MYSEELKHQQTIHYKLTHLQTGYSINSDIITLAPDIYNCFLFPFVVQLSNGRISLYFCCHTVHVTHLRKCSIIPNVTMVGEAVMYKSKFAFLAILFNGVQCLFSRYLLKKKGLNNVEYKVHKATMFPIIIIIIIITDKLKKNKVLNSCICNFSSCIHLKTECCQSMSD